LAAGIREELSARVADHHRRLTEVLDMDLGWAP
jgi:hypothetical protein